MTAPQDKANTKHEHTGPPKVSDDLAKIDWSKLSDGQTNQILNRIIEVLDPHDVAAIHRFSDANQRSDALHHTLGGRNTQASPGDHLHDGGTSVQLVTATISGVLTASPTAASVGAVLKSLLTALAPLGITDATT